MKISQTNKFSLLQRLEWPGHIVVSCMRKWDGEGWGDWDCAALARPIPDSACYLLGVHLSID